MASGLVAHCAPRGRLLIGLYLTHVATFLQVWYAHGLPRKVTLTVCAIWSSTWRRYSPPLRPLRRVYTSAWRVWCGSPSLASPHSQGMGSLTEEVTHSLTAVLSLLLIRCAGDLGGLLCNSRFSRHRGGASDDVHTTVAMACCAAYYMLHMAHIWWRERH